MDTTKTHQTIRKNQRFRLCLINQLCRIFPQWDHRTPPAPPLLAAFVEAHFLRSLVVWRLVREMGQPQAKRGGAGRVDRTKSNISTIKRISNLFHSDKNFVHIILSSPVPPEKFDNRTPYKLRCQKIETFLLLVSKTTTNISTQLFQNVCHSFWNNSNAFTQTTPMLTSSVHSRQPKNQWKSTFFIMQCYWLKI